MSSTHAHPGVLHRISPPHVAFEHRPDPQIHASNTPVFLGGLFHGLLTVPTIPTSSPPSLLLGLLLNQLFHLPIDDTELLRWEKM